MLKMFDIGEGKNLTQRTKTCKYREGWSSTVENDRSTSVYYGISRNTLEDARRDVFGLELKKSKASLKVFEQ